MLFRHATQIYIFIMEKMHETKRIKLIIIEMFNNYRLPDAGL